jgi:hypothetical protein
MIDQFYLSDKQIGIEGAKTIAAALENNSTVTSIHLGGE